MHKYAIVAENLIKHYTIGDYKNDSLKHSMGKILSFLKPEKIQRKDFIALKGVSFSLLPGEILGIVGCNGAGKSTLLKVLSRITKPTAGIARVYGRVGTLLEIGTGFHPDLTGLENIYLNGAILGMRPAEISKSLQDIVDFSGVGSFIQTPVKHYSSGMTVRLAFSVAAHLEADIIFLDEVWGTGDQNFLEKSIKKIEEIIKSGRTIVMISHDLSLIRRLATRCFWMEQGQIKEDGQPAAIINHYLDSLTGSGYGEKV